MFEPQWEDDARPSDGLYMSNDKDQRTEHPSTVPQELVAITAGTYDKWKARDYTSARQTFTCFERLPLKLRLIIWKNALPGPRIVEVLYDHSSGKCWSTCPIPLVLQVNHESRTFPQKSYKRRFGTFRARPMTWFNAEIDQINIGVGNFGGVGDVHTTTWDPANTFSKLSFGQTATPLNISLLIQKSISPWMMTMSLIKESFSTCEISKSLRKYARGITSTSPSAMRQVRSESYTHGRCQKEVELCLGS